MGTKDRGVFGREITWAGGGQAAAAEERRREGNQGQKGGTLS